MGPSLSSQLNKPRHLDAVICDLWLGFIPSLYARTEWQLIKLDTLFMCFELFSGIAFQISYDSTWQTISASCPVDKQWGCCEQISLHSSPLLLVCMCLLIKTPQLFVTNKLESASVKISLGRPRSSKLYYCLSRATCKNVSVPDHTHVYIYIYIYIYYL